MNGLERRERLGGNGWDRGSGVPYIGERVQIANDPPGHDGIVL